MKIFRPIAYVLLAISLLVLVFYNKIIGPGTWHLQGPLRFFLLLAFGSVITAVVYQLIRLGSEPGKKIKAFVFLGTVVVMIFFILVNPFEWPVKRPVQMQGHWQGKGSSGRIILYQDDSFEIRWYGLLRGGIYYGDWEKKSDTIYLEYVGRELDRVGTKLLAEDNKLFPVNGHSGLFLRDVYFDLAD